MSVCVLLSTLNDEGKKMIREHPEKMKEFNKEIEALGVKIRGQYVLVGQHDILEIFEGESKEAICKVGIDSNIRGVTQTIALMGMSLDEYIGTVKK
ncbi:GYD domain-containing protein [Chloroflexota bacterium]